MGSGTKRPPMPTMLPKSVMKRMADTQGKGVTDWANVPIVVDCRYAAELLGFTHEVIRKNVAAGIIPAVKILGEWRINKDDLMTLCGVRKRR